MADVQFSAQILIETGDAVKRLTGDLEKFGNAFEKELTEKATKTMETASKGAGQWAGIGQSALSGVMNPLMTMQEIKAKLYPDIGKILGEKIPYIGKEVGAVVKTALQQGAQRTGYITTGAKQAVMGQAASFAAIGGKYSDEQLDQMLKLEEAKRTNQWEQMKRAAGRSGTTLKDQGMEGAVDVFDAVGGKIGQFAKNVMDLLGTYNGDMEKLKQQVSDLSVPGLRLE